MVRTDGKQLMVNQNRITSSLYMNVLVSYQQGGHFISQFVSIRWHNHTYGSTIYDNLLLVAVKYPVCCKLLILDSSLKN